MFQESVSRLAPAEKKHFYKYNGLSKKAQTDFYEVTKKEIEYYPFIVGFSKDDRIIEFTPSKENPVSSEKLSIFLKALFKT